MSCGPEIATRFSIGLNVGIPAAFLVIAHRLFKIASRTAAITTPAEKRRALLIDLAIGLGIPLVQMPLREYHTCPLKRSLSDRSIELVVEGHRFDILEEIGCIPNTYNVTLAFPLVYIWPIIISLIAAVYSGMLMPYGLSSEFRRSLQPSPHNSSILEVLSTAQTFARIKQESQPQPLHAPDSDVEHPAIHKPALIYLQLLCQHSRRSRVAVDQLEGYPLQLFFRWPTTLRCMATR